MPSEGSQAIDRAKGTSGWQGVVLIAATYVYFLIFAQFGFLKRLEELGIAGAHLRGVMAAMAFGGIAASLLAPRMGAGSSGFRLRCGLGGCGAMALLSVLPLTTWSGVVVALGVGASLGLLTVTLVADLDLWVGNTASLLKVGLGTGLGYFVCNVPVLFTASPRTIAWSAAAVCVLGAAATAEGTGVEGRPVGADASGEPTFFLVLAWFTALIWLDSAAFFIIQSSPALKSGTWEGAGHLWRNGFLHLGGALGSAWLLRRRGLSVTLLCAFASLGGACLVLLHPERSAWAAALYPVGVSLYSVALVAAPAFLLPTKSLADRARKAGWIYAVAGWIGSALGIGMGQNLHHVPAAFVALAACLFLFPLAAGMRRRYLLEIGVVALSLAGGYGLQHVVGKDAQVSKDAPRGASAADAIALGRGIYISEGCIHCHSQYVRPNSTDVQMWGPTRDVESIRREKPPLIGNRRQGPDLSEVGSRRSALWLRIHFMNPRDVSYESIMPQYKYLFQDDRGELLLAYVASLRVPGSEGHLRETAATWTPVADSSMVRDGEGRRLFEHYCSTCHGEGGKVREAWGASFSRLPPNLSVDPLRYVAGAEPPGVRKPQIARIIKFGIPGTNMPGHEYLPDGQIEALSAWVTQISGAGGR